MDTMRDLLGKYPDGYEGYREEEAIDVKTIATDDATESQPVNAGVSDDAKKRGTTREEDSSGEKVVPKL